MAENDQIINFEDEPEQSSIKSSLNILLTKDDVNPYDIFLLAKWILIVATVIYVLFGLIRIFYSEYAANPEGIEEVWEYSKVILNSIVSLVLGLYFGSKQESRKNTT